MRFGIPLLLLLYLSQGCAHPHSPTQENKRVELPDTTIYTARSNLANKYTNFDSPKAINHIAQIENKYFRAYETGISSYYGTVWREHAESRSADNLYRKFTEDYGEKGDSMHCTLYAIEALQAGMATNFDILEQSHRRIWKKREHAGWSIGYLLVKEWGWKAYLVLDRKSEEFDQCLTSFKRKKEYPVWRQPNIPLKKVFIRGEQDSLIQNLLQENEFGWGFSHQGIHTWITRFDILKECNWLGAPGKKYEISSAPLFLKRPFLNYYDYNSHVLIFPPKNENH